MEEVILRGVVVNETSMRCVVREARRGVTSMRCDDEREQLQRCRVGMLEQNAWW